MAPKASAAETVRPPEVEWKSVSAILPSYVTTSPAVAWIAFVARASSASTPP